MEKIPFAKIIVILPLFIIIVIINTIVTHRTPIANAIEIEMNWAQIKKYDYNDSAVFQLYIDSSLRLKYLEKNEYLLGDKINYCNLWFLGYYPKKMDVEAFSISFTSPSGRLYPMYFHYDIKRDLYYTAFSDGIVLNESGIWYIDITFLNQPRYMWEYSGDILRRIKDSSIIKPYSEKTIIVYTNLEYQQLRAAKASEEASVHSRNSVIALFITAIATFAAACVAAYNVFLSKNYMIKSMEEQEKSRRVLFRPKISAKLHFFSVNTANIKITNVGKGSALDVKINCKALPTNEEINWTTKFLEPNESQEIHLQKRSLDDIWQTYDKIVITAKYKDIYNENFEEEIEIDLEEIKKALDTGKIVYHPDYLKEIYKELKNIKDKIK